MRCGVCPRTANTMIIWLGRAASLKRRSQKIVGYIPRQQPRAPYTVAGLQVHTKEPNSEVQGGGGIVSQIVPGV